MRIASKLLLNTVAKILTLMNRATETLHRGTYLMHNKYDDERSSLRGYTSLTLNQGRRGDGFSLFKASSTASRTIHSWKTSRQDDNVITVHKNVYSHGLKTLQCDG